MRMTLSRCFRLTFRQNLGASTGVFNWFSILLHAANKEAFALDSAGFQ
jgi:hypothetical protein